EHGTILSCQASTTEPAYGPNLCTLAYDEEDVATMTEQQLDRAFNTLARPTPPQTRGLPLVGALPRLLKRQFDFFTAAHAAHGDVYTLDLGFSKLMVFNQPRHAEHILRDNIRNYRKGGAFWDAVRSLVGNGLVVSEGEFWLRQRRMMQPQFHR